MWSKGGIIAVRLSSHLSHFMHHTTSVFQIVILVELITFILYISKDCPRLTIFHLDWILRLNSILSFYFNGRNLTVLLSVFLSILWMKELEIIIEKQTKRAAGYTTKLQSLKRWEIVFWNRLNCQKKKGVAVEQEQFRIPIILNLFLLKNDRPRTIVKAFTDYIVPKTMNNTCKHAREYMPQRSYESIQYFCELSCGTHYLTSKNIMLGTGPEDVCAARNEVADFPPNKTGLVLPLSDQSNILSSIWLLTWVFQIFRFRPTASSLNICFRDHFYFWWFL